ncbi:MAG TPA: DNA methylase [Candidatus Lachnoclostridium stercoravium]|uniref:DNA methylase n=1 Tax=Candidatus Lachnoclostridium stercoravium TaxID=2838633 RepID=A0A9D2HL19_9FIRM|nr:DNA methylase [Candidatus Lachnoclostridium stercoravium]
MAMDRTYICIDLKSYYASVECVHRGLDPLKANLLVADPTRSDQTICLAVSPSLKAMGVPGRPRLFEAKQAIRKYEAEHHTKVQYIIAVPRMAEYERISAKIYGIYLHYVAPEDVHVYSIDECFIDVTGYLHMYLEEAKRTGTNPAHVMAMTMIREVLSTTGITATVGIGTNLYLAKVAMDIVAKKQPADKDGVRIAELNEDSYKFLLWDHQPLTDFWQIGPGKARRLYKAYMFTMGDIAERSQWDEEFFYKQFGIDGEILLDHAWGIEPVTMADIKNYKSEGHSLSNGQVLPRPYKYQEARLVFKEMIEVLCNDMFSKNLVTRACTWWVSYDYKSLEACPNYDGPVSLDFYGRLHPKHSNGTVKLRTLTNNLQLITAPMVRQFDEKTDHRLLYRRLGVCAVDVSEDIGMYQMNMFVDYEALDRDRRLTAAMLEVRRKYGTNTVFKGMNMLEGATTLERNTQIGGHKA